MADEIRNAPEELGNRPTQRRDPSQARAGYGAPGPSVDPDEQIAPVPERCVLKPGPVVAPELKREKAKDARRRSVAVAVFGDGGAGVRRTAGPSAGLDPQAEHRYLRHSDCADYGAVSGLLPPVEADGCGCGGRVHLYGVAADPHQVEELLPRDPSDIADADSEDPRRELVERLLEHERFKAAAQMLRQKQQIEEATWSNPGMRNFLGEQAGSEDAGAGMEQEIAADTVDLVRVFQDVLARLRERPVLDVNEESVTVAQMLDYVKRRLLMEDRPVSLRRLLHSTHSERALICMFLAMLELVRLQAVLLHQPRELGDILIKKADGFDQVFAEQAQARDDWR